MPFCPINHEQSLICGAGHIAVVTGWTEKKTVAKRLSAGEYAVIGNLYSATRGISPLLRNLLANPQIDTVVIMEATGADNNAGSAQCLFDFFTQGFSAGETESGRPCWRVNSAIAGYIDKEIPEAALERIRANISAELVDSLDGALSLVESLARYPNPEPWAAPETFPEPTPPATAPLGPVFGQTVTGETIGETWLKIIHRIRGAGLVRPTCHGHWQELISLTAIVTDEPNEFLFPPYLPLERRFLPDYIAQIVLDGAGENGSYTYGQRLRSWFGCDQVQLALDLLVKDPDTSRAVLNLWDVWDYGKENPPCLNHIWLRVINGALSLVATFRSNDMFSAWPANAMGLRALQIHFRRHLEDKGLSLSLGPLLTVSQSAHIYEDCWESADAALAAHYPKVQRPNYHDPSGSFLISVDSEGISAELITPGAGESVRRYHGHSAARLYRSIAKDCPALDVDHALYLGAELQKAETALYLRRPDLFIQDHPFHPPTHPHSYA